MNILAIDTGLQKIGFAYWDRVNTLKPVPPSFAGVYKNPRANLHLQHSCAVNAVVMMRNLLTEISNKCRPYGFKPCNRLVSLVVEGQQIRKDAVGLLAGGDVINLATSAGAMVAWHAMMHYQSNKRYQALILQPKDWKGQMSKATVAGRITRMIGEEDRAGDIFQADAWDAVGIGLVAQGHDLSDLKKVNREGPYNGKA